MAGAGPRLIAGWPPVTEAVMAEQPSESPTHPSKILAVLLLFRVAKKSYTMGEGGLVLGRTCPTSLVGRVLVAPGIVPGTEKFLKGLP